MAPTDRVTRNIWTIGSEASDGWDAAFREAMQRTQQETAEAQQRAREYYEELARTQRRDGGWYTATTQTVYRTEPSEEWDGEDEDDMWRDDEPQWEEEREDDEEWEDEEVPVAVPERPASPHLERLEAEFTRILMERLGRDEVENEEEDEHSDFVSNGGEYCPVCGSEYYIPHGINRERTTKNVIVVMNTCSHCESTWKTKFRLFECYDIEDNSGMDDNALKRLGVR